MNIKRPENRRKIYQMIVSIITAGSFLLNSVIIDLGWAKEELLRSVRLCETLPGRTSPTENDRMKRFEELLTAPTGDYVRTSPTTNGVSLSEKQCRRIDEAFAQHREKYLSKLRKIKRDVSVNNILNYYSRANVPDGTMRRVAIPGRLVLDDLKYDKMNGIGFEFSFWRIRGTDDWIIVKGEEHKIANVIVIGDEDDGLDESEKVEVPFYLFDIEGHNHPYELEAIPSNSDLWNYYLKNQGSNSYFIIRAKNGITIINVQGAADSLGGDDFKYILVKAMDRLYDTLKNKGYSENESLSPGDPIVRPYLEQELSKLEKEGLISVQFIPWDEVSDEILEPKEFRLSEQLQLPDAKSKERAFKILTDLFDDFNVAFRMSLLDRLTKDSSEELQEDILYNIIFYFTERHQINQAISLFMESSLATIRALASVQIQSATFINRYVPQKYEDFVEGNALDHLSRSKKFRLRTMIGFHLDQGLRLAMQTKPEEIDEIGREPLEMYLSRLTEAGMNREGESDPLVEAAEVLRKRWGMAKDSKKQGIATTLNEKVSDGDTKPGRSSPVHFKELIASYLKQKEAIAKQIKGTLAPGQKTNLKKLFVLLSLGEAGLTPARSHIARLQDAMENDTVRAFIKAVKKMAVEALKEDCSNKKSAKAAEAQYAELDRRNRIALQIVTDEMSKYPDIPFDPDTLIFTPYGTWLDEFLFAGEDNSTLGFHCVITDNIETENFSVVRVGNHFPISKIVERSFHEVLHNAYTYLEDIPMDLGERSLFEALVEGMTEKRSGEMSKNISLENRRLMDSKVFPRLYHPQRALLDGLIELGSTDEERVMLRRELDSYLRSGELRASLHNPRLLAIWGLLTEYADAGVMQDHTEQLSCVYEIRRVLKREGVTEKDYKPLFDTLLNYAGRKILFATSPATKPETMAEITAPTGDLSYMHTSPISVAVPGAYEISTRKNILDTEFTASEEYELELFAVRLAHTRQEKKTTQHGKEIIYYLIEYSQEEWPLKERSLTAFNITVSGEIKYKDGSRYEELNGKTVIFVPRNLSDREIAIEHEELEIYWRQRIESELTKKPEFSSIILGFENNINRAAHILAWADQILRYNWQHIEDVTFLKEQLSDPRVLGYIVTETSNNRSAHNALHSYFFNETESANVKEFENNIWNYANQTLKDMLTPRWLLTGGRPYVPGKKIDGHHPIIEWSEFVSWADKDFEDRKRKGEDMFRPTLHLVDTPPTRFEREFHERVWSELKSTKDGTSMGNLGEYDRKEYDPMLLLMYHVVGKLRGKKVLEIGSNANHVVATLRQYGGVDALGVDQRDDLTQFVNGIGGAPMITADLNKELPSGLQGREFDLTFSRRVFDFGKKNKTFLHNLYKLTKPGGWSIHTVYNGFRDVKNKDFKEVGFKVVESIKYMGGFDRGYYVILHRPKNPRAAVKSANRATSPAMEAEEFQTKSDRSSPMEEDENKVNQFLRYFGLAREAWDQSATPFAYEPRITARYLIFNAPRDENDFKYGSAWYHINVILEDKDNKDNLWSLGVNLSNRDGEFVVTFDRRCYIPAGHLLWKALPHVRALLAKASTELGFKVIDRVMETPECDEWKLKKITKETFDAVAAETNQGNLKDTPQPTLPESLEEKISWASIKTYADFREQFLVIFEYHQLRTLAKKLQFLQAWSRQLVKNNILPHSAAPKKQDIDEDARLVKEDRRARAKVRLAKITTRKKEEARQREMQRQKAEIRVIIDEINRTSEEEIFDDEVKESIAEKVSTWGLAKERSVLVVGHSGNDYLPILLTKLGLRVSVIDLNKREVEEQNRLHRQFGLDKQIESFDSYEALGDRKYDYITALAVINDAINTLETDRLQQLAAISATATGEQREGLENVARSVFEPKVKEFIRPILLHLNPDNGYFLVNKPGVISTKINRQFPDLVVFVDKLLVYLDNVLPSLGDELGISFTPQPHIDVGNFTMHPSWFSELRVGAAYQCGNTSPLTLESLPPVMPPSITNIQNRLERCANEWPA